MRKHTLYRQIEYKAPDHVSWRGPEGSEKIVFFQVKVIVSRLLAWDVVERVVKEGDRLVGEEGFVVIGVACGGGWQ